MKLQRTNLLRLGSLALLLMQPAMAATVTTPSDGDIFLGFRASGGQGSGVSLLINVGNDTVFRNAAEGTTLDLGSVGTQISSVFGNNWNTRGDLHWGFFGARNVVNPPVYASRAQVPVGYPATAFNALAANARNSTKNQIISVITAYQGLQAVTGNPAAAVQTNSSVDGSYNHQVTGGTTSFGTLSQWTNIEGHFGNGASESALDFFRLSNTQTTGDVVSRVGTFEISATGALSFSRALAAGIAGIKIAQSDYQVDEDANFVTLTFRRTNDISAPVSATFSTADGSATAGLDYTQQSAVTVSFDAGEITKTVNVPIAYRSGVAPSRQFTVTLASPSSGASLIESSSATVTIQDVDKEVQFATATPSAFGRDEFNNPNTLEVEVVRSGSLSEAASVDVSVTGGSLNGTYYTFTSPTTLSFAAEDDSETVSIPLQLIPDNLLPGTILLTLSNAQGVTLGTASTATVTVNPNPGQLAFTAASFAAQITDTSVQVTLQRENGSAGEVSVQVTASSTTLINGTHYSYTSPTVVTFADGQTEAFTTVQILGDAVPGSLELTLSNPTGAANLGLQSSAVVNLSAEPGVVSFASQGALYLEESAAGQIVIPLVRTGGSSGAISVTINTANDTAIAPGDYTALSQVVHFADGQSAASVSVSIINDAVKNEANEVFYVNLSNPVGTDLGSIDSFAVTILDLDTTLPTVTITEPKANAKVATTNENEVIVKGTAKDNKGVAKVEVKINDGAFTEAELTVGTKGAVDYEIPVTAETGINVLTIRSTDYRGNVSKDLVSSFVYDDPYPSIAGVYTGLVTAADETVPSNSTEGLVSISVTAKGTFSGKLTIDSYTLAFSGTIAAGGQGLFGKTLTPTASLTRKSKAPLTLALSFDLAKVANSHRILGTVVDGSIESELSADRSLYTNKKNPAAPLVNPAPALVTSYTVLFKAAAPGAPNPEASEFPQGDGWGTVVVSNAGVAKVTGALADGSTITYSAPLSIANRLPFYVQLYKKQGSISGPVKFENLVNTDLDGDDLFWFRPADVKSKVYADGWPAGITTDLIGSRFIKAGKSDEESILGYTGNGTITFTGGTLEASINKGFSITAANKVTNVPADKTFSLKVAGATGIFSGSFTAPAPQKKPAFKGVVLQKTGEASGFFLSTATTGNPSQSGKVTLAEAAAE